MSAASRITDDQIDPASIGLMLAASQSTAVAAIRAGRIIFANPAFRSAFSSEASLNGASFTSIVGDHDKERLNAALAEAVRAPTTYRGIAHRGDDRRFDLELTLEPVVLDGEMTVLAFAWDVTGQHRSAEQLSYLAYVDPLTGLPNRSLFTDRLHQTLLAAKRGRHMFAVLMIDLDGFKAVNDGYGHEAGDVLLHLAGQRFASGIRASDTVARLGGDEFAVILPRLDGPEAATRVAARLIKVLEDPFELGSQSVVVAASIGIASYPEHATLPDALLAAADTALYRAKRSGRNQFCWAVGRSTARLPPAPTWNAMHAVGVTEIDQQHAHMAELIDVLSVALKDGADRDSIMARLNELIGYTDFHFRSEERLMAEYRLPNLLHHQVAHRRLLDDIRNLRVDTELPSISLILRYLQEWLVRHVDGLDKELGRALVAAGCH